MRFLALRAHHIRFDYHRTARAIRILDLRGVLRPSGWFGGGAHATILTKKDITQRVGTFLVRLLYIRKIHMKNCGNLTPRRATYLIAAWCPALPLMDHKLWCRGTRQEPSRSSDRHTQTQPTRVTSISVSDAFPSSSGKPTWEATKVASTRAPALSLA